MYEQGTQDLIMNYNKRKLNNWTAVYLSHLSGSYTTGCYKQQMFQKHK